MSAFDLTGRVALITGGNGGIGLGMARGLARAGATVMIAGRNAEKNGAAIADLKALGATCDAMTVDVADEDACRAMPEAVKAKFGRLDILINNAGIAHTGRPQKMTMTDWNAVMQTNVTSVFVACQAAYPIMKVDGGGKIINIGSIYSLFGAPINAAYSTSKGAIVQLTKSLAAAWATDNIQVNAILPGWIDTDMTRTARTSPTAFNDNVLNRTPVGRWGVIDDLEGPAEFLASSASDFVTGASLAVDGGFSVSG